MSWGATYGGLGALLEMRSREEDLLRIKTVAIGLHRDRMERLETEADEHIAEIIRLDESIALVRSKRTDRYGRSKVKEAV